MDELAAAREQAETILHRIWSGRSVCIIAQYFNDYFSSIAEQLRTAGARVVAAIAAYSEPNWVRAFGLPVFDLSVESDKPPGNDWESVLLDPPDALRAWIDEIDPAGSMCFLGSQFVGVGRIHRRSVIGWRRPDWASWEDKAISFRRFAEMGIPAPRGLETTADDPHLSGAFDTIDRGLGVVIAREGGPDKGGGSALKLARGHVDALRFAQSSGASCLRLCEFVRGVPCSAVGIVLNGAVLVFDPIEIVTLVDDDAAAFVFCGSSSHWRPSRERSAEIRAAARQIGQTLASQWAFSGGFSLDGVMTAESFVATEVNARNASGMRLRWHLPGFPYYLFIRTLAEAFPEFAAFDATMLERVARERIAACPSHSILIPKGDDAESRGTAELEWNARPIRVGFGPSPAGRGVRILKADLEGDKVMGGIASLLAAKLGKPNLIFPPLMTPASGPVKN